MPDPFGFEAFIEAQREHMAACTLRPCPVCHRDTCPRCGEVMMVGGTMREVDHEWVNLNLCEGCADAEVLRQALREIEAMIPRSFAWAKVGGPLLRERVGMTRAQFDLAWRSCVLGNESLTLVGEPGSGKTSLAAALFRAAIDQAMSKKASPREVARIRRGMFVSAYELARDRAQHPLGAGQPPLVRLASRSSLLVIDDLGSEPDTQLSAVTDVLYERHAEGRVTWITTWLDEARATARYGGGIARRIFERATILHLEKAAA